MALRHRITVRIVDVSPRTVTPWRPGPRVYARLCRRHSRTGSVNLESLNCQRPGRWETRTELCARNRRSQLTLINEAWTPGPQAGVDGTRQRIEGSVTRISGAWGKCPLDRQGDAHLLISLPTQALQDDRPSPSRNQRASSSVLVDMRHCAGRSDSGRLAYNGPVIGFPGWVWAMLAPGHPSSVARAELECGPPHLRTDTSEHASCHPVEL